MTNNACTLIKVGGSLFEWPPLAERLRELLANSAQERVILFPGGGTTADSVRAWDKNQSLGEESAHWLAVRALTVNAYYLQALLPGLPIVAGPDNQGTAILDPYPFTLADEADPDHLPHCWQVTSDSLAARAAHVLGAQKLLLLKSTALRCRCRLVHGGTGGFRGRLLSGGGGCRAGPGGSGRQFAGGLMSKALILATRNTKKREEIEEILTDLGLELHDLSQYPQAPEVVEDGATFEANARKKASETAVVLGQWTLGEDSGLVVPALGGRPGVYSALRGQAWRRCCQQQPSPGRIGAAAARSPRRLLRVRRRLVRSARPCSRRCRGPLSWRDPHRAPRRGRLWL